MGSIAVASRQGVTRTVMMQILISNAPVTKISFSGISINQKFTDRVEWVKVEGELVWWQAFQNNPTTVQFLH